MWTARCTNWCAGDLGCRGIPALAHGAHPYLTLVFFLLLLTLCVLSASACLAFSSLSQTSFPWGAISLSERLSCALLEWAGAGCVWHRAAPALSVPQLQLTAPCYVLPANLPSFEQVNTNLIPESDALCIGITECVTLFKESCNLLTKTNHESVPNLTYIVLHEV